MDSSAGRTRFVVTELEFPFSIAVRPELFADAGFGPRRGGDHFPTTVEFEHTAAVEHLSQFVARTLHPAFGGSKRNSQFRRDSAERHPFKFVADQWFPIFWRELGHEAAQTRGEVNGVAAHRIGWLRSELNGLGLPARAVVVRHHVSGDAIDPALKFRRISQRCKAAVNTRKNLLQQIVSVRVGWSAGPEKTTKRGRKIAPKLLD